MVSMLKQNVMSLVFVYLLMTALVAVGSWYRESYYGDGVVHEGLGLVDQLGYSLSSALGIISSSGDDSSSSSSSSSLLPSSSSAVSKKKLDFMATSSSEDILDDDDHWAISSVAAKRSINSVVESSSQDGGEEKLVGETQVHKAILLSEHAAEVLQQQEDDAAEVVQGLQGSISRLYHSPKVLALNYKEMMEEFKIFVYPVQNESRYELGMSGMMMEEGAVEPSSSTSDFFFKTLVESEVVTEDPEEAQLFFLPVSIDRMLNDLDLDRVGLQLRRYVARTREQYEYWNRTLGADHFYLSCHGFPADGHRNFLELRKNAIQVACTPLRATQGFFPHKDIVMPPYRPIGEEDSSAPFEEGIAKKKQALQTTLVYYNDPFGDDDPALQLALADWKSDPDFDLKSESLELPQYYHKLGTSRFCLSITPHKTLDLVDSLRLGCVPVLISNSGFSGLPFQDILNWQEFSVVLELKDIRNLKHILTGITSANYQRMQYLGQQASKHMEWNVDPLPYDAFHMILYELWLRRYCIRYALVSSQ
ncbi:unnamed protein product [Sphagnum balticum]